MFGHDAPRLYGWIKRANAAFGGASALDIIRNGQLMDLYRVRRYLDAERGAGDAVRISDNVDGTTDPPGHLAAQLAHRGSASWRIGGVIADGAVCSLLSG